MTKSPRNPQGPGGPIERIFSASVAKRIRDRRMELGLNRSDLARKIWGTVTDARGYEVAANRERISVWEAGKQVPTPENIEKLAAALEMSVSDLAPDMVSASVEASRTPAISMTMVEGRPDTVRLVVNTLTSLATASKIIDLLSNDPRTSVVSG